MLNLGKYRWTYSEFTKAAGGLSSTPGMPHVPHITSGFSPPKIPKPQIHPPHPPKQTSAPKQPAKQSGKEDPRGYRVGTIRRWRSGPHIKMDEGWFPYDPSSKKYQDDEGNWKEIDQSKKYRVADFPPAETLDHAITGVAASYSHPENSQAVDHSIHIADHFIQLGDGMVGHKSPRIQELAKSVLGGKKDKVIGIINDLKSGNGDNIREASVQLMEMLSDEDTRSVLNEIHKYEERKDRTNKVGEGKYIQTSKKKGSAGLTGKAKDISVMSGKSVSTVLIRTGEDGTEGIMKFSVTAPSIDEFRPNMSSHVSVSRREVAAYDLDQALGNICGVPETVLLKDYLPDEDLLETASADLKKSSGINPHRYLDSLDRSKAYEASNQRKIDNAKKFSEAYPVHIPSVSELSGSMQQDLCNIAAFDYIIGNTDRHLGNILITTDASGEQRAHPIDHGYTFTNSVKEEEFTWGARTPEEKQQAQQNLAKGTFNSQAAAITAGMRIPKETLAKLKGISEEDFKDTLQKHNLDKEGSDAWKRLQKLISYGKIPPPHKYL